MNVFNQDNGPTAVGTLYNAKECKRDYEGEIKRAREQLANHQMFLAALYAYLKGEVVYSNIGNFTLAELVGRLELTIRIFEFEIYSLIEAQERETK